MKRNGWIWVLVLVLFVVGVGLGLGVSYLARTTAEEPVARSYSCAVYTEQGCAKFVIASGGEIEIQSGATLDVQSGSSVDFAAGLDMNSNTIVNIGAAGTDFGSDGSLVTAQTITVTAGGLVVTAGGATITAGGLVIVAGGADIQGGDVTLENDETLSNANDGTITATVAAGGSFNVATGNLTVGDPSGASLTLNGNDGYIEGTFEADGGARFDGGVTVGAGDVTISNGLFLPTFADLLIGDGDTVTVTAVTVYGLDSAGEVTMTLAVCSNEGQSVTLIGDDANTININATNLRTTDGNALTLGQYDVIALICQDSEWLHVSKSANQ